MSISAVRLTHYSRSNPDLRHRAGRLTEESAAGDDLPSDPVPRNSMCGNLRNLLSLRQIQEGADEEGPQGCC